MKHRHDNICVSSLISNCQGTQKMKAEFQNIILKLNKIELSVLQLTYT